MARRTREITAALDLARDTRGLLQHLQDHFAGRDSITLEFNSIDGLLRVLQLADDNLLGVCRLIDPDSIPAPPVVELLTTAHGAS